MNCALILGCSLPAQPDPEHAEPFPPAPSTGGAQESREAATAAAAAAAAAAAVSHAEPYCMEELLPPDKLSWVTKHLPDMHSAQTQRSSNSSAPEDCCSVSMIWQRP